jgi:hypothetical protein
MDFLFYYYYKILCVFFNDHHMEYDSYKCNYIFIDQDKSEK